MRAPFSAPGPRSLSIAVLLLSLAFAGILAVAPVASAQSPNFVSGNACLSGSNPTWRSGDTWIMYGNVTVPVGCMLTIEPGAIVKGDPDVHLYVNGALVAGGQAGSLAQFLGNQTAGIPWAGIQFNGGATGSVTWSSFLRVLVAVYAQSSSPGISNNTIVQAGAGVRLDASNSLVADNRIDGERIGAYGILVTSSSSFILGNTVNGTNIGIQAGVSGSPAILNNRITNMSGALALGIYVTNLASVSITGNTLLGALGASGGPGGSGSAAVGILANGTPSVTITGNSLSNLHGGRGGAGPSSAVGLGGAGGFGGGAAGIAVGSGSSVTIQGNTVSSLAGGRGGDGGSSASLGSGGRGGRGGDSVGVEIFSASSSASFLGNTITNATGGDGGDGGAASGVGFSTGAGGAGGNAYGLFSLQGMNPDLSSNTIQSLRGGRGGNSTASAGGGVGGAGGEADGIIALADGNAIVHANTVSSLTGGAGANGVTDGGAGGNSTALLILGDGTPYNATTVSFNQFSLVTGGTGGIGGTLSGAGGPAGGIVALHADPALASNTVSTLLGGAGGQAFQITNQASTGGMASGIAFLLAPSATSSGDRVQSVTRGSAGSGRTPPSSYGVGYYFVGSATVTTQPLLTNASVSAAGSIDLYVDNYTEATALNTSFAGTRVAVMNAGNLTVENFLAVRVFWPNNSTFVQNALVTVKDDAATAFSGLLPSGQRSWIVVTNRRYIDSPTPTYHTTNVSASYGTFRFWNDPRFADMNTSHTESFGMVDASAPTSKALALPRYETAWNFSVPFTASDQNGTGVASVTLWYQFDQGSWTQSQILVLPGPDRFAFAATSDGVYAFATVAADRAGNVQQPSPPAANNTWTVVDTSVPASHMASLARYETSLTFGLSWAPNPGVTDIANFTIQVNTGSGWTDWLTNTAATSGSYTATTQGSIAFRVLATDAAGNRESKVGNDTWTIVDTIAPLVVSRGPTGNLTASPTSIVITFSEPMNVSSVEAAFSISPGVTGTFTWSNGSRILTFQPSAALTVGTSYTVTIGTGAEDLAGNPLGQASVFTFATPAPPAPPGLSLADLWPLLLVLVAVLAGIAFFLVRRRGGAAPEAVTEPPKPAAGPAPKAEAAIDDVFLLYRRDGVLIKHETRRLRPDIDTDILSGMLTAVQQFVKDSFRGDEDEELNEMTVGQMHILIGRGKWLVLAATLTGGDMASMTAQIQKCVTDMEDHNWDRLEDWDGDMEIGKALGPYLKKLIRGEYAN